MPCSVSASAFIVEQQLQATDWLRVIAGLRHDRADFDVSSDLAANSGSAADNITSPKLSLVFGPWADTELFVNAGRGFHENDARGTTITVDPADGVSSADRVRPMVRASGRGGRRANRAVAVHAAGADGMDAGSRLRTTLRRRRRRDGSRIAPAERRGVELGVFVTPLEWLTLDADLAWSRSRFSEFDPARQITSPARSRAWCRWAWPRSIPAAGSAARASVISVRRRSSKTTACAPTATTLVNLEVGRRIGKRFSVALAAYNVFDSD